MLTVTRSEFEALLNPLLIRAIALVDEALSRANLSYADIDVILPVGGSSRIPLFRRELAKRWGRGLA
jgi:molecular chaperone DnaK (HSP70)